jgi:hypothetical protein
LPNTQFLIEYLKYLENSLKNQSAVLIKIHIVNHFDYILCASVEKLKEIYLKFLDKLYNIISSLKVQNKSIEVFHSNNLIQLWPI